VHKLHNSCSSQLQLMHTCGMHLSLLVSSSSSSSSTECPDGQNQALLLQANSPQLLHAAQPCRCKSCGWLHSHRRPGRPGFPPMLLH
jgi:hypothetical protein